MRPIPLYLVIPICLGTVALVWWNGTKRMDFMTPPDEAQLTRIRLQTAAAFSKPQRDEDPDTADISDRKIEPPIQAAPLIDPGDPQAPATLEAFREYQEKGGAALMDLAVHLEDMGGNARALLAWERVLDACQPDDSLRASAIAAISRLRPLVGPWNVDPLQAIDLTLEAAPSGAIPQADLSGMLEEISSIVSEASSGLIELKANALAPPAPAARPAPGRRGARPPAPSPAAAPVVSLQILSTGERAASTGVIEISVPEDAAALRQEILRGIYGLVASQIAASTEFTPPAPLADEDDPVSALALRITRLAWQGFGKSLLPPDSD